MTEDEAKTKWCPMVRTGLNAGMAVNHHVAGDVNEETRCIASDCMMWRWNKDLISNSPRLQRTWVQVCSTTQGHCGLAGSDD